MRNRVHQESRVIWGRQALVGVIRFVMVSFGVFQFASSIDSVSIRRLGSVHWAVVRR